MKFLIIFIYLITFGYGYAIEKPDIKNITVNKDPKLYENITFKNINDKNINLSDLKGKLLLLNFWATWCAPCKKEMPSLDILQVNSELKNLKIFPINIAGENLDKSKIFFEELQIKNLDIYYDSSMNLAKKFSLRGIPTSILINKDGKEFARIVGSIDFNDKGFINWLKNYN